MEKVVSDRPEFFDGLCASCKWRSDDFTSVCVNDASDHLADFVAWNDFCEKWEEKRYEDH